MKDREYRLLEAISADEGATQAGLATNLGIAVGSVNWYIKRLISRGYLKATRMDRTRLRYNLTSDGLAAFRRNATQYAKDSLKTYRSLREQSKRVIEDFPARGISSVHIKGAEPELDIFRLTCLESGVQVEQETAPWQVGFSGGDYTVERVAQEKRKDQ